MGIKSNFNKFLKTTCGEDIFEEVSIAEFGYTQIAVDVSLYMYRFKSVQGNQWLASFLEMIACFRRNQVHPVFIFDGQSPSEKKAEQDRRCMERQKMADSIQAYVEALKTYEETGEMSNMLSTLYVKSGSTLGNLRAAVERKKRQLVNVNKEDYIRVMELCECMNVPYYTAPWEAEKFCACMCIDGIVDAVLSEDTDVIAYGTPCFLSKFDMMYNDTCMLLQYDEVLQYMDMSEEQFLDFCVMCGNDYNMNIPQVGSSKSYKYLQTYGCIENIPGVNTTILNYECSRRMFTDFSAEREMLSKIGSVPYCKHPEFTVLDAFMQYHKQIYDLEKIRKHCDYVKCVIEE